MAVALSTDLLPGLLSTLQNDDRAIHIRGEIKSKLCSLITDCDVIVDRWPDYTAVVARVNAATAKCPVHLGPLVSVFTTHTARLETLLRQPDVLDWSARIIFVCVEHHAGCGQGHRLSTQILYSGHVPPDDRHTGQPPSQAKTRGL
ncbi:uncharacterized protein [Haliotis cracherodii]|uniref:uncharacterized protein n=1 Tax=Haliotis cracherodii TaxID=6455 RepID=UPI0039EB60BB